jgi:AraC-like DNA-binding protein
VLTAKECREVTDYLISESQRLAIRLDMRLLVDKAFPDYIQHRAGQTEVHWKDLVTATLEEQLVELKHTARPHSRQEQKQDEQDIVRGIISTHKTHEERVAAWQHETGKSERAFYRRLQELD